ncbi:sulfite exporter TauE/SafE family protein [Flavobacterium salilacus subsp. salilacus]|uniref:sulfite exporter TauE/SafE family protein n=1 Tax=Flavobacterium TaxID=237 RepID=UPI0010750C66|nr:MULTISPECIES: sulfite exporter TauE/SafE family protein [Flavobacterium]KAF2514511.1 sulfite exporter TauE/SafE family protein [Flavobacterium salilacus subsp. salilacus]MBE1615940.1 sulfite exporter TauE/SafE family protein [Flavobacterium sp. SaA2.13]
MTEDYYLFVALALVCEVIGTVSGFGSSILFVPLASMFFDFKTVLGITAVFHVFSNLSKIALFRKGIDKNIAFKLGIPAVIFVIAGAWFTTILPSDKIELLMNIVLVILAGYLIFNFNKTLKQTNNNLYLGGTASGFLAGLVGTGGAIRGITLAAFRLPKEVFIATSALIDLGVDFSRAVIYVGYGYFKKEYMLLIPFLIGISIVGSYLGKVILKYTSEKAFRYIVLGIIVLTSVFGVVKKFYK